MPATWNETATRYKKSNTGSGFFIAILSSHTGLRRGFVNTELNQALEILQEFPEGKIFIIPVRLDNCDLPYHDLHEIQYVDFFPRLGFWYDKGFEIY